MSYEQTPYHHQPQASRGGSGMAATALVLGVVALLTCWTIIGGILLGLVAVVLGFLALSRVKQGRAQGKVMAIIGIVTGALGLLLSVGLIALGVGFLNSDTGQDLQDCLEQAGNDEAAQAQCQRDFEDELLN